MPRLELAVLRSSAPPCQSSAATNANDTVLSNFALDAVMPSGAATGSLRQVRVSETLRLKLSVIFVLIAAMFETRTSVRCGARGDPSGWVNTGS